MNGPADNEASNGWHWDRYWQADRLSACLTDAATGNYARAIRTGWVAFFGLFPDGTRLLDIGTGNGAVPLIAREIAAQAGRRFEIHGVDRADIDPARFVHATSGALADIHFHGRTSAESLPFRDRHFDGLTGQYALEYTDPASSVRELARVARHGARLRFVLHAEDATPVAGAARNLADIAFLTGELRILDKARALMRAAFAFERANTFDPRLEDAARKAREDYLAAAHAVDACHPGAGSETLFSEILGGVRAAWDQRRKFTLDYILTGLDRIEEEIRAHQARLEDMRRAALSREGLAALATLFRETGFNGVRTGELRAPEGACLLGWELQAALP